MKSVFLLTVLILAGLKAERAAIEARNQAPTVEVDTTFPDGLTPGELAGGES